MGLGAAIGAIAKSSDAPPRSGSVVEEAVIGAAAGWLLSRNIPLWRGRVFYKR